MATFSNVTYGSRFSPTRIPGSTGSIPMGSSPYSSYGGSGGGLAGLLAGGLRATGPNGPTPNYSYMSTVTPGTGAAPSAQAQQQISAPWQPGTGGFNFGPGGPTIDQLSTDPILQQIQAQGQRAVQDARSAALANAENALIGYGGVNVPSQVSAAFGADQSNPILAALADANTAKAAAANPDSALARLLSQNTNNQASLNQDENARNLFYSSTRGNDLGTLANQYRSAQNDAGAQLAQLLGQANTGYLNTEQAAQDNFLNGLQGAWSRWLQMQQLFGGAPTTSPGAGGPVGQQTDTNYWNPQQGWVGYTPAPRPGQPWYQ